MRHIYRAIIGVGLVCSLTSASLAATGSFYKEANVIGGYSKSDHWVGKKGALKNSIGFEYFKKFSDDYGDYLTVDLQMRLAYDSLENSKDAWAIEIHNAWLEYKLGLGSKLRFGHFDPAFGLEPLLDTHGSLFQTMATKNIGFKKDWGLGYSGLLGPFDYEVAGQIGSGMGIRSRDGSHLISGRIGRASNDDFQYGLSLLYGKVLESSEVKTFPVPDLVSDIPIDKQRVGLDAQYFTGPYKIRGEVAYGKNDDEQVMGFLSGIDYTAPKNQALTFNLQGEFWAHDISDSSTQDIVLSVGAEYKLNSDLTLRLGYFHDLENYKANEDRKILVQLYYFGF